MPKYHCQTCNYSTDKTSTFKDHNKSSRHLKRAGNICLEVDDNLSVSSYGTIDDSISGQNEVIDTMENIYKKRIQELERENELLKIQLQHKDDLLKAKEETIELLKSQPVTVAPVTPPSNSPKRAPFSMETYLAEECKRAINIMDTIPKIEIRETDIALTENGPTKGIIQILNRELKNPNTRSIHCSDEKRLVFYIKDNDVWTRHASDDHKKLELYIKHLLRKNWSSLHLWEDSHPGCRESENKFNDKFNNIFSNLTRGCMLDQEEIDKLVRHIAKLTTIEK